MSKEFKEINELIQTIFFNLQVDTNVAKSGPMSSAKKFTICCWYVNNT